MECKSCGTKFDDNEKQEKHNEEHHSEGTKKDK